MIKRLVFWLVLVLVAAAAFVWWRRSHATAAKTLTFRTTAVQRGDVTQTVTGSGTLSALTTADVGSQVSGNVKQLYADYNDTVKEGQLIAEIDPSTYEAKVSQAEANLLASQASLGLKQLNVKRSKELLDKALVSQADYDQAIAELRQQEASAKNSEASVTSAKLDLDHCKIYSPVSGVVLKRAATVGQTVQSSYSVATLFSIARDLREMEIEASISEADIGTVESNQTVTFTVDAFPSRSFQGKVRQVRNNSTTSNNVVTYPVIISADNADLKLRPGMTANIVIATTKRTNVIRVPNSAVRFKAPDGAVVSVSAAAAGGGEGGPSFDQMPEEVKKRVLAENDKNGDGKLDADERKSMEANMRNQAAAANRSDFGPPGGGPGGGGPGGGPGGGGGGGGGARASSSSNANSSTPVTMYVAEGQPNAAGYYTGALKSVQVFVGVSDASNTEILSGLKEGDVVITGTLSAQAAAAAAATTGTNNIFGPQRPGGRR